MGSIIVESNFCFEENPIFLFHLLIMKKRKRGNPMTQKNLILILKNLKRNVFIVSAPVSDCVRKQI